MDVLWYILMFRNLQLSRPLAVLDLETTGLNILCDRIVEISVLIVQPDMTFVHVTQRINPEMAIPSQATKVHGIKDEDVAEEMTFLTYAPALAKHLEGCDLCGYNLKRFDLKMLIAEFKRAGLPFVTVGRSIVDPLDIFHSYERRNLAAAVKFYLGHEHQGAHTALGDVQATAKVLDAMLDRYPDLARSVDKLHEKFEDKNAIGTDGRFKRDGDEICFNFGKYKGQNLDKVAKDDLNYLKWIVDKLDISDETMKIVCDAISRVESKGSNPRICKQN